ncbi:MAG: glutamine-hydrolyzing carbamoyl-phosphate synthase small subunit [Thermoanaerobaculum sp.]|nr:glutamine-hydrolyzing carbamoyl-phosphate synthase small subunit [Thermoanaerobaculum sp.]
MQWGEEARSVSRAFLALKNGAVFSGWVVGKTPALGEVVFNTAMFGYQEMLTDPSYRGQILVLTTPHVGVVGTNPDDWESSRVWAAGLVVQDLQLEPSNWRATGNLLDLARSSQVPLGFGFDTRALVMHLRQYGSLPGALVASADPSHAKALAQQASGTDGCDLTEAVTCPEVRGWEEPPWREAAAFGQVRVGVLDLGVKASILRRLIAAGAEVVRLPRRISATEVAALGLDGLVISNGPGDPAAVSQVVGTISQLLGRLPLLGICLGHQLLALALGGRTYKLKFGHHGANHPVRVMATGEVWVTAQNHNYAVDGSSLPANVAVSMVNLTDGSVEGLVAEGLNAEGVQFHPEAGPGPHEGFRVFSDFVGRCRAWGSSR